MAPFADDKTSLQRVLTEILDTIVSFHDPSR